MLLLSQFHFKFSQNSLFFSARPATFQNATFQPSSSFALSIPRYTFSFFLLPLLPFTLPRFLSSPSLLFSYYFYYLSVRLFSYPRSTITPQFLTSHNIIILSSTSSLSLLLSFPIFTSSFSLSTSNLLFYNLL